MKRQDVTVGSNYIVRVSGHLSVVRIDTDYGIGCTHNGIMRHLGYKATNTRTGRTIRVTAGRLRCAAPHVPAHTAFVPDPAPAPAPALPDGFADNDHDGLS